MRMDFEGDPIGPIEHLFRFLPFLLIFLAVMLDCSDPLTSLLLRLQP
jgi:hypothetical protein